MRMAAKPLTVRLDSTDYERLEETADQLGTRPGTLGRVLLRASLTGARTPSLGNRAQPARRHNLRQRPRASGERAGRDVDHGWRRDPCSGAAALRVGQCALAPRRRTRDVATASTVGVGGPFGAARCPA